MKPDISFILNELLTDELGALSKQEIEPLREFIKNYKNKYFQESSDAYFEFEGELSVFALNQFRNKNYKLAKKCYLYLKNLSGKDQAIDILIKMCDRKRKI